MKLNRSINGLKKFSTTGLLLLMTSLPTFAEKKNIFQQFIAYTGDYFYGILAIIAFVGVISTGLGIMANRKNTEKREEEMNGMLWFGVGAFIMFSAGVIAAALGAS